MMDVWSVCRPLRSVLAAARGGTVVVLYVCGVILLAVALACIPFGTYDMSLLDRFRGIRRPTERDNKGLDQASAQGRLRRAADDAAETVATSSDAPQARPY